MEMRELISSFDASLRMKLAELSRLEKEVAIIKSTLNNDLRAINEILRNHCKDFIKIED